MCNLRTLLVAVVACFLLVSVAPAQNAGSAIGIFEGHNDVGTVLHPGSVDYDASQRTYTISGSGENMWLSADAFQFAWKKISGDVTLSADISFLTTTGNEHKKATLMLRQTLDADSVYADVALHASGLTSLQFRDEKGAITRQIQSNISAPKRLRIAKRGDYVYMSLAADGGEPKVAGGWLRIPLQGPFYVGLGVCSHDKDVVEKAVFSNVELTQPSGVGTGKATVYSTLETVTISSPDRRVVYLAPGRFEAPNWTRDGSAFLFNRDGHIERLAVGSDKPVIIDTGFATRCNNDHGISPDATHIAISDNSQSDHNSLVYVVPIVGGTPRRITQKSPSYWHGWSPDGKTLAFVGQRNGDFDIYTIPVAGGDETRLTTAKGLDDGPEYSPDGKYIYFNSERTGHMQIWRMKPDGREQEQVFSDDLNNWFPHISPDGQWMVFLTYAADVTGHPENKDVMLRLMALADSKGNDKKITVLAKLFGGQGTINVPSWSPDSKQVAFVSYLLVPEEGPTTPPSASVQTGGDPSTRVVLTKLSEPRYPPLALQARITGEVRVQLVIRPDGAVESAAAVSGDPMLSSGALESARQSQYECRGCSGTNTVHSLTYTFQIVGKLDRCCCSTAPSRGPSWAHPEVSQLQDQITVSAAPVCVCPDPCWADAAEKNSRARSPKCLYLWKCGFRHGIIAVY